jgi:hypothetical protein
MGKRLPATPSTARRDASVLDTLEARRHFAFGDLDTSLRGVGWTQLAGEPTAACT